MDAARLSKALFITVHPFNPGAAAADALCDFPYGSFIKAGVKKSPSVGLIHQIDETRQVLLVASRYKL
jgi:hypothetical protein